MKLITIYRKGACAAICAILGVASLAILQIQPVHGAARQIFEYPGQTPAYSKTLAASAVPCYVVSASGTNRGILLKSVSSGYAQTIGMTSGDVLLSLNQRVVTTAADADRILYNMPEGQLKVTFVRPSEGGLQLYNVPMAYTPLVPSDESGGGGMNYSFSGTNGSSSSKETGAKKNMAKQNANIPALESFVVDLINSDRRQNGVTASLQQSPALGNLARSYAQEMAAKNFFAHVAPDGRDPQMRAEQAGLRCGVFENISWSRSDYETLSNMVRDCEARMMAEPPNQKNHRSNILDPDHICVGVGIAIAPTGKLYMVQEFSHRQP